MMDYKDHLYWKTGDKIVHREPARSFWQRFQYGSAADYQLKFTRVGGIHMPVTGIHWKRVTNRGCPKILISNIYRSKIELNYGKNHLIDFCGFNLLCDK